MRRARLTNRAEAAMQTGRVRADLRPLRWPDGPVGLACSGARVHIRGAFTGAVLRGAAIINPGQETPFPAWTSSSSNCRPRPRPSTSIWASGYRVLPSYGHVRDLPEKDGSVLPDEDFRIIYEPLADREKRVDEIARALKRAERLYLATDPDREGEAISWHLLAALKEQERAQGRRRRARGVPRGHQARRARGDAPRRATSTTA